MRVNIRGRDHDRKGPEGRRKSVPQGPDESSPVRSAGLAFLKSINQGSLEGRARVLCDYVAGMTDGSVPDGTIDECWQSLSRVRNQKPSVSIVLDPKVFRGLRD
jgi:Phosphohydrolase-associated domain